MDNKLVITLLTASLLNIGISFCLYRTIEKHSVHPVYGVYQQKVFGCEPWDSCSHGKSDIEQNNKTCSNNESNY